MFRPHCPLPSLTISRLCRCRAEFIPIRSETRRLSPPPLCHPERSEGSAFPFSVPPPVTNHQSPVTKSFAIRTYAKPARNPFRIRTSKTQHLKPFRMNTYEKTGGGSPSSTPGILQLVTTHKRTNSTGWCPRIPNPFMHFRTLSVTHGGGRACS